MRAFSWRSVSQVVFTGWSRGRARAFRCEKGVVESNR